MDSHHKSTQTKPLTVFNLKREDRHKSNFLAKFTLSKGKWVPRKEIRLEEFAIDSIGTAGIVSQGKNIQNIFLRDPLSRNDIIRIEDGGVWFDFEHWFDDLAIFARAPFFLSEFKGMLRNVLLAKNR